MEISQVLAMHPRTPSLCSQPSLLPEKSCKWPVVSDVLRPADLAEPTELCSSLKSDSGKQPVMLQQGVEISQHRQNLFSLLITLCFSSLLLTLGPNLFMQSLVKGQQLLL